MLPVDQYTSQKARGLAARYAADLRTFSTDVYHCLPWLEVQKHSVGFFRPRHLQAGDDRYLSVRIFVEQDPSPEFAKLSVEGRASAMFSRYFTPMLSRMARNQALLADSSLDGFTVVIEWLKQVPRAGGARPVHETIAAFIDRASVQSYLSGQSRADDLTRQIVVFGWDGETALGALKVVPYEDDFVKTYRNPNYKLQPGVTCS
jgi:hypothetical protein